MRGNLRHPPLGRPALGSIPARAGEPRGAFSPPRSPRVYPRTCGGTHGRGQHGQPYQGLSPHVRGNRQGGLGRGKDLGSIPARAGEPPGRPRRGRSGWVYPRTCGGTNPISWSVLVVWGLSPHVRGNPLGADLVAEAGGSIPARAGEPGDMTTADDHRRVYPRTCGGTRSSHSVSTAPTGLSPHVRGNHELPPTVELLARSIPARAGEPSPARPTSGRRRVYPRTCGGTYHSPRSRSSVSGLSPHVRGNLLVGLGAVDEHGSIPARAGEPPAKKHLTSRPWVYPRTCGGTDRRPDSSTSCDGLSPHVRGNPLQGGALDGVHGSIPARAGEP